MVETAGPKRISEQGALGQALKRLRKRADLTQEQAAEKAGVVVQSWRRYEWGERDLSFEKIGRLAEAIGATREQLLHERAVILGDDAGSPPETHVTAWTSRERSAAGQITQSGLLPVRDRVQAGAWLVADDYGGQTEARLWAAAIDPRYPHASQWLSEVVGDSVNELRIFEGDLVQCVDAIAIGYAPKTGDIVEVERLRFQGAERELTIKQVEVSGGGGIMLWPRSTNPRWKEPLIITAGMREGEEAEIRVRGLVISLIRRFP